MDPREKNVAARHGFRKLDGALEWEGTWECLTAHQEPMTFDAMQREELCLPHIADIPEGAHGCVYMHFYERSKALRYFVTESKA